MDRVVVHHRQPHDGRTFGPEEVDGARHLVRRHRAQLRETVRQVLLVPLRDGRGIGHLGMRCGLPAPFELAVENGIREPHVRGGEVDGNLPCRTRLRIRAIVPIAVPHRRKHLARRRGLLFDGARQHVQDGARLFCIHKKTS
jgi:hypothetical protein